MSLKLMEFAVLALIKKGGVFKESYNIIKVLNWKFGFLEVHDLIKHLMDENYISKNPEGLYDITELGNAAFYENFSLLKQQLLDDTSFEKEFIFFMFKDF